MSLIDDSKKLIGKLFDKYDVLFPTDNELSIIIGPNGSGKTKILELLYYYFNKQNENVIYFPSNRILTVNIDQVISTETLLSINNEFYKSIKLNINDFKFYPKYSYINSGNIQMINFITNIINAGDNLIILIDCPEDNLDLNNKKIFIDLIKSLYNVKKLIFVTHQFEMISKYTNNIIHIENIVNII